MRYLTGEEVLVIHAKIIDETGGLHGVRDTHLLASLVERPKMGFGGTELYPGVFRKAAAYFESCAHHHIFLDGNKRTAIAIAGRFLFLNGRELKASNEEMEQFVLEAVREKFEIDTIADWLEKRSRKLKKRWAETN